FLFRDDFDGAGLATLDRSSWNVEVNCNGGGNNELQCYVDSQDNIDVRDGMLHITARKESDGRVTSGRLTTEGKVEIAYGRWEARLKRAPPDHSGESLYSTAKHSWGTGTALPGGSSEPLDLDQFHTVRMDWSPDKLEFFVNGERTWFLDRSPGSTNYDWPYAKPHFALLNLAIGGDGDTYPTIEQNAMALFVGERFIEVIALHCLINALLAGIPGKQLALALSMTLILPLMGYHAFVHSVGPPGPMLLINLAISALTWIEYGWADLTKKAEAEMKTPMYIHGVIVSTSFVPYYIAEAMGMPFPLVGLKELDPTTPDPSPMTQFTYFFVALFMAMYSYTEIKGTMEGKVFAVYHYALSCIIAMWQFYPTTTLLGRLFFSLPHAFTLWFFATPTLREPARLCGREDVALGEGACCDEIGSVR
ncbi:hypothetical protein EMIHUDRAFT_123128, partial [Emiliania huxleyi CCMP1516]|uniref:GH16 domain-containing protein n=2 Tax=Emiliania huxleyi TaxID=2903 RepID=A0A0D3K4A8_EMIH1